MSTSKQQQQDFTNFPPVPDGHTRVFLNHSWGPRNGRLYGPGWAHIPDALLPALEAVDGIVRTDSAGAPLSNSLAASHVGAAGLAALAVAAAGGVGGVPAIPFVEHDEDGNVVDDDEDGAALARRDPLAAARATLDDAAQTGERSGLTPIGDEGSHTDESRTLNAKPGQFETSDAHKSAAARDAASLRRAAAIERGDDPESEPARGRGRARAAADDSGSDDDDEPATKRALREYGDREALQQLAEREGVKYKDDDTKEDLIDKLYAKGLSATALK